jgi:hypothetical protein
MARENAALRRDKSRLEDAAQVRIVRSVFCPLGRRFSALWPLRLAPNAVCVRALWMSLAQLPSPQPACARLCDAELPRGRWRREGCACWKTPATTRAARLPS